jgi:eukaryotic translation initiation factor 2C
MKLIQNLQRLNTDIFTPQAVYDGKKNMFAPRRLPLGATNSQEVRHSFDFLSPLTMNCAD